MLPRRLRRLPRYGIGEGVVALEARGFRARLLGLAFLRGPPPGTALLIPRCRSVHTFGMRFDIDVRFLDGRGATIRLVEGVGPRRVLRCPGAAAVLESPSWPYGSGRC